jgi:hypothetical protein
MCNVYFFDLHIKLHVLQEWPHASYPPWAHGPGYIISNDIASFVVRSHYNASLKVETHLLYFHPLN